MKDQTRWIAFWIGLMCLLRFSFSAFGYVDPLRFMHEIGIPLTAEAQMSFAIRSWAIRDMAIAGLVVVANPTTIRPLLVMCVAIDCTDILSAALTGTATRWVLQLVVAVIAALLPELIALILLSLQKDLAVSQPAKGE
jgi:hypothetical protein